MKCTCKTEKEACSACENIIFFEKKLIEAENRTYGKFNFWKTILFAFKMIYRKYKVKYGKFLNKI